MRQSAQHIKKISLTLLLFMGLFAFPTVAQAAITVYTTDVIADASRTNFVGFEGMAGTSSLPPLWEEDGIRVEQINGDGNDIWSTYDWGQEGFRSWYPSGGDVGHTKISLISGGEFSNMGLLVGTGWGNAQFYVQYALLLDGVTVAQGEIAFPSYPQHLGFAGGGFDTVLLSASTSSGYTATDGHYNAMAIDSIELAESINQPPDTPVLTSPENDATVSGTSVRFSWEKATDPEGTDVTYLLQIAENDVFTENLREYAVDENGILIAGLIFPFFALLGWGAMNRRKMALLMMAGILIAASLFIGCEGADYNPGNGNTVSFEVTGLESGTTYFWRVIAVDEDGTSSFPSETRTFTTN